MRQRDTEPAGLLARLRNFLTDGLWNADLEPRSWPARGLALVQFAAMIGEGFVRDRLLLRASALAYFTVLSLIPVLAIAIGIATGLGNLLGGRADFETLIVEQIAAGSPEAQARILELIRGAIDKLPGLGVMGAAVLVLTTILGISNVERALNHIWGVKQPRAVGRRFSDYLTVMIVAPTLLLVALSLRTSLESQWIVQRLFAEPAFAMLYDLGLRHTPTAILTVAFAFLSWFMPNTSVRVFAALLGGVVAAVLVTGAQSVYLTFQVGVGRANALFGSFAALPLLFLWIYLFWAIALFGAEVAFAYQNLRLYRREVRGRSPGPAERESVGLRIALEIARAFREGLEPWSADELSDALDIPVRTVRGVLASLQEGGFVSTVGDEEKEGGYQLGRPADAIRIADLLAALRGEQEPIRADSPVGGTLQRLLDEIAESELKGPAGQTLSEVLGGIPPEESST